MIFVLAPRNAASVVFTPFRNGGDWCNIGLALMIGHIGAIYACICSDSAAHMSEKMKDAGKTGPRAMFAAYFMNSLLEFVFLIAFIFSIVDLGDALNGPTGYPHFIVFRNEFGNASNTVLSATVTSLVFAGTLSFNLSTSRQTWALSI